MSALLDMVLDYVVIITVVALVFSVYAIFFPEEW
jgi:hypothetical protein